MKQNKIIKRNPVRLWLAASGAFVAAILGWIRFGQSLVNAGLYQSLGVQPGAWYLTASGLIIGLVYTLTALAILSSLKNKRKIITILLVIGLVLFWIDRIFFARSLEAQTALPFSLVFSAGLTFLAYCLVFWETIKRRIRNG